MPLRNLAETVEAMHARSLVFLMLALALLAACEKPFEPTASSDIAFSIFGHLDAAADTQWVRVMPIRQSLGTVPGPIDAIVTLEEIETGTTVLMSDSLIQYLPVNLRGEGLFAHNFSTTMPIVPGRHYRLTVTRSDGASASATVLIPVWESPTMVINHRFLVPNNPNHPLLARPSGTIQGTRHFAMVLGDGDLLRPTWSGGDKHNLELGTDARPSGPQVVTAVASGVEWLYGAGAQLRDVSTPEAVNNFEGQGLGFFGGVQTHVFPFAWCTPLQRTSICTITFSPRSATLVGVVTNGCTGEPIAPVDGGLPKAVQVRLLGPPAGGVRYETTDGSGTFKFIGMEPGAAYSLALEQLPRFEFGVLLPSTFLPLEIENVLLGEAAVDTLSIVMEHRGGCPPPDLPDEAGVDGVITNAATGARLAGANIYLSQGPGGPYVTHADQNGFYQIGFITPGVYRLRVSHPGFVTHEETLPMAPRDRHTRSIQLVPVSATAEGVSLKP